MARDPRAYLWDAQEAAKSILTFPKNQEFAQRSLPELMNTLQNLLDDLE